MNNRLLQVGVSCLMIGIGATKLTINIQEWFGKTYMKTEDAMQLVAEEGYRIQPEIWDEAYRAGRYHLLADLIECQEVESDELLRDYLLLGEYMNENGEALNMRVTCEE